MQDLLAKARRLSSPKTVSVALRPEVYQWLKELGGSAGLPVSVVVRSFVEDGYDRYSGSAPSEEVSE